MTKPCMYVNSGTFKRVMSEIEGIVAQDSSGKPTKELEKIIGKALDETWMEAHTTGFHEGQGYD